MSSFDPAWEAMRQRNAAEWRRDVGDQPASTTRADVAEAYEQALARARADAANDADPDTAAYERAAQRNRDAWKGTAATAENRADEREHQALADTAPAGEGQMAIDDGDDARQRMIRRNASRTDASAGFTGALNCEGLE